MEVILERELLLLKYHFRAKIVFGWHAECAPKLKCSALNQALPSVLMYFIIFYLISALSVIIVLLTCFAFSCLSNTFPQISYCFFLLCISTQEKQFQPPSITPFFKGKVIFSTNQYSMGCHSAITFETI